MIYILLKSIRLSMTFTIALLFILMRSALAQSGIEINLAIHHIPRDGLIFSQISLGSVSDQIKGANFSAYKASFRANGKSYAAQLIPSPSFGVDNYNAMLLIAAPGERQLTGALELERREKTAITNSYTVSTKSAAWKFVPRQTSIFPSQIIVTASGKTYTKYNWEDRLYDSALGGFNLADDKTGTINVISDGSIATVIRGTAHYVNPKNQPATGNPIAIYDWYFFKNSPLIFVDAVQSAPTPFQWDQSHFMEWNFKEKYFSGYIGKDEQKITPLTDGKTAKTFPEWAALLSDHDAIAYVGDKATIYDGVSGFGNYIRSANPSPSQDWNGAPRRLTAWLWVADFDSSTQLSTTLDEASKTVSSRFAESNVSIINTQKIAIEDQEMPSSLSNSAQDKNWIQSLLQRQVASEKVSIPSTWHFMKSGNLGLALDIRNGGVQLISLYDLQKQQELSADAAAPIFEVQLFDPVQKKNVLLNATKNWKDISFHKTPDGFTLVFQQDATNNPINITVTASALTKDSAWSWAINIGNKNSAWAVQKVLFPQIKVRRFGDTTKAFIPIGPGQVVDQPFAKKLNYNSVYPTGSTATMQFMAIYQNAKNPTGLYVARHDPTASLKTLQLDTNSLEMTQLLSFSQLAENHNTPGNTFHFEGSGVWKLLNGNWFDAAKYYKSWIQQDAPWWPAIDNNGRIDAPLWYKKLNVWSSKGGDPNTAVASLQKMKDFIGLPMGDHWYYWHQIPFDNDYPHYFPAVPGFKEATNTLQQKDIHVMPYINGRLWDTRDKGLEDYKYTKEALPWTTKTLDDARLIPYKSTFHSKESDGSKVLLAVMCPYTTFWQNTITGIVKKLTTEVGVDGVYIDQIGMSAPVPCMDSTHGHPLGGGHWWVDGYNEMLKKIQQTIPANAIITTEGNAEPYMKYIDGMLSWEWEDNGQVPAYSAVYGSAVQLFGRSYSMTKDIDPNISIRMKAGQELIFGEQIGWISPDTFFNSRVDDKTRNYFKQVAHVRDKINPYIYAGEMLRPPLLTENNPAITADWVWQGKSMVTTNSVLTAAWKKYGAHQITFVFTNVSTDSLQLNYPFNPSDYGIPSGDYEIKQWNSSQPNVEKKIQTNKSTFGLTLPGLSSIVWEISWK